MEERQRCRTSGRRKDSDAEAEATDGQITPEAANGSHSVSGREEAVQKGSCFVQMRVGIQSLVWKYG
jgi:hypothetical protein